MSNNMLTIDLKDFHQTVDNKFWKHITRDSLIPQKGLQKDNVEKEIVERINNGTYVPSGVREFIIYNKSRESSNRLARIVPLFYVHDYVLEYFLLKKLECELSQSVHPNAFGSFRNFKLFRDKENKNDEILSLDSLPSIVSTSSFYRNYWIFEWKEFMGKARKIFLSNQKYRYFISFDVADFYSSINLLLLEKKVRGAVPKEKQYLVDLLFYFLQNYNKKFKRYTPEVKGIPQDEVGDMSRVLANFFLQDFDYDINIFAGNMGATVLRYADDHIIFASNEKVASKILFYASIQLQKIGLCVNCAKIKDFKNRSSFKNYWAFNIHESLDNGKWKESARRYLEHSKKHNDNFRKFTLLMRFLDSQSSKIECRDYHDICQQLLNNDLISTLDWRKMQKLYDFLPDSQKQQFLRLLVVLSNRNIFNSYHLNLLRAIDMNKKFKKYFDAEKIDKINQRIDKLAIYFS